jgi:type II restriction/modification system DNA methylase subunit YeeA
MTPQEFIAKWKPANLSERSAAQQHFLDLCDLLGQPKPAAADPEGAWYTFERGVHKTGGGEGWADVWWKDKFAWEYKRKRRNLLEAYKQLLLYREDLENPPLLVVSDLDRFEIHTNFTAKPVVIHAFSLDELAEPKNLDILRKLFTDPKGLEPGETIEAITKVVAERFSGLAEGMRVRNVPAEKAAHFLMKLMFCMFAEDIELLPAKLFSKLLTGCANDPDRLNRMLAELFQAMCKGGDFGVDSIKHFNGGLFADADVVPLLRPEIAQLIRANECDWSNVEPSIFGTLFERTLDPAKRSQIGAHYTSKDDILTLLKPVLMVPMQREWAEVQADCEKLWAELQQAVRGERKKKAGKTPAKLRQAFEKRLTDFGHRLAEVKVLDPACGSGNFLYVAINLLLDLENAVITYGAKHGVSWFPLVSPRQLAGLEINPYAQQLAQVVIWIGYLQWLHHNGFKTPSNPVLEPIENIHLQDAILDLSDPEHPREPVWPEAEFMVGNPPFLGSRFLRRYLGDQYVDSLFHLYDGRVSRSADLCCYWFEKARAMAEEGRAQRVGLLGTQGIRGGASRRTLDRVRQSGEIFFGVSDQNWTLDGAMVHVSMVGFDNGRETRRMLDGRQVANIYSNLQAGIDLTTAKKLASNLGIAFQGVTPMGPFDIPAELSIQFLMSPINPNGRPNSDVVRRWANGKDLIEGRKDEWVIDFPDNVTKEQAALYQGPFEYAKNKVLPERLQGETKEAVETFWRHWRSRPAMRNALAALKSARYLVTPRVAKHRLFIWVSYDWLPSDATVAFAIDGDFEFGVLQCRIHEGWARKTGTQLREAQSGFRYTHQTCFETFPVAQASEEQRAAIAEAANELDRLRNNWLNPPEWTREEVLEFPGSVDGPWARFVQEPDARGIGTVRYPRVVAKDPEFAKLLARRTLTNLYNERPTWLDLAHRKLDEAVFAAYGWDPGMSDEEILAKLLELNLRRSAEQLGGMAGASEKA